MRPRAGTGRPAPATPDTRWPDEPPAVRRALGYVREWTTVELLCVRHPHRRDHSPAERRAARLALGERGFARPIAATLSLLALPTVRDAWDGGAGMPDVLRGWAALALVATGIGAPVVARLGSAPLVRRWVVWGAIVSLLLFVASWLGARRRTGARLPRDRSSPPAAPSPHSGAPGPRSGDDRDEDMPR